MFHTLTLISYFILLFGQALWAGWLNPAPVAPKSVTILFIIAPLLLPLRGLLHARFNTFKWLTLFIWIYFTLGVWNCASNTQWLLGVLQVTCSLAIFLFAILYLRQHDTRTRQILFSKKPQ